MFLSKVYACGQYVDARMSSVLVLRVLIFLNFIPLKLVFTSVHMSNRFFFSLFFLESLFSF